MEYKEHVRQLNLTVSNLSMTVFHCVIDDNIPLQCISLTSFSD